MAVGDTPEADSALLRSTLLRRNRRETLASGAVLLFFLVCAFFVPPWWAFLPVAAGAGVMLAVLHGHRRRHPFPDGRDGWAPLARRRLAEARLLRWVPLWYLVPLLAPLLAWGWLTMPDVSPWLLAAWLGLVGVAVAAFALVAARRLEREAAEMLARAGAGPAGPAAGATSDALVDLLDKVLEVVASLNAEGVDYVVIGGVALNLHGLVRATEDLDLFIRPEPANVQALQRALGRVWDDPAQEEITAHDLCGDYPAVRYGPPDGSLPLDILARLGEFATFADLESDVLLVDGVEVSVATPATLHWLKAGTVRPRDQADAAALREAFGLPEEAE